MRNSFAKTDSGQIGEIGRGEAKTIMCDFHYVSNIPPLSYADISISVKFHPSLIPFAKTIHARFETRIDVNGELHWYPKPLTEVNSN
jgi:hypothetical protein